LFVSPHVEARIKETDMCVYLSGTDVGARQADADQKKSARRKALMLGELLFIVALRLLTNNLRYIGMQSNTDLSDAVRAK
jgi:hypothetical protein